jgi:anti-sigma factor RsiW
MRQPPVRCVEFVESVTDWMEDALDHDDRLTLEEHLAICPHCTEYVGQLRLAAALLRGGRRDRAAGVPAARSTRLAARRLPPRAGSVRVYPSSSRSVSHTDWNARSAA